MATKAQSTAGTKAAKAVKKQGKAAAPAKAAKSAAKAKPAVGSKTAKPKAATKPTPKAKAAAKSATKPATKAKSTVGSKTAKPKAAAKPTPKAKAAASAKPVKTKPMAKAKPVKAKPATKAVAKAKPTAKAAAKAKPTVKAKAAAKAAKAKPAASSKRKAARPVGNAAVREKSTAKAAAKASPKPQAANTDSPASAQPAQSASRRATRAETGKAKVKTQKRTPSKPEALAILPERVALPIGYQPKPGEEYMSPEQLEYFRQKLLTWRADLVEESQQTMDNLRDEVRDVGDDAERATRETENSLELRTRDRYRKLISKIDKALKRIDDGEYGYCEETGEEIGLERLEARPIATLCFDAQERWEHRRRLMGD